MELTTHEILWHSYKIPTGEIIKGQVGTIVEFLEEDVYQVEFAYIDGRTITSLS